MYGFIQTLGRFEIVAAASNHISCPLVKGQTSVLVFAKQIKRKLMF